MTIWRSLSSKLIICPGQEGDEEKLPYRTVKPAYPALEVEIACRQIKKKDIAKAAGISADYLSKKLTGRSGFTLDEALAIHEKYFSDVPVQVLFKKSGEVHSHSAKEN
jgi:hypothetical protein